MLAAAVKTYATGVATKTAEHDTAVTDRTKTYRDELSTRQQIRDNAVDGAEWAYERSVVDSAKVMTCSIL